MTVGTFEKFCPEYVAMRLPKAECRVFSVGGVHCIQFWDRRKNRMLYLTAIPTWVLDGIELKAALALIDPLIRISSSALSDAPSPALAALN